MATSPLPRTGPLCSANEGPPLLSSGRPLGWGETDSHAPAQDETRRSPVCPPLPPQARATTSVGVGICPGWGRAPGCVRVRTQAQVSKAPTSGPGLWRLGARQRHLVVCRVCPLCDFVSATAPEPLQVRVSVRLSASLAEAGEGWLCPPVCLRDSGTTGPFTSCLQQQESDSGSVRSPRRFRPQQGLDGGDPGERFCRASS